MPPTTEPRTEAEPADLVWRQCVCGAWYWGSEQTDADRAHSRLEGVAERVRGLDSWDFGSTGGEFYLRQDDVLSLLSTDGEAK